MDRAQLKQALMEVAIVLQGLEEAADRLMLFDVEANIEEASTRLLSSSLIIIQQERLEKVNADV